MAREKEQITSAAIFSYIVSASIKKKGFCHVLAREDADFSHQALSKARIKLPFIREGLFKEMNKSLQTHSTSCTYAVDGSKFRIPPSFKKCGFKSRTNDKPVSRPAKRPVGMLSSLLNVRTQTCYYSIISSHFDERKSAIEHMKVLNKGDTMIFERGYFSKMLVHAANEKGIKVGQVLTSCVPTACAGKWS